MKANRLPVLTKSLSRSINSFGSQKDPKYVNGAVGGKENFEKDFENSHIKTNAFQKIVLGLGSGVVSITSPSRGDMIAVNGEVTGSRAFEYIQSKMLESSEGRKILEEKPRISSVSVDLEKLKTYPEGTLGKSYSNFLEKYGYTPNARNAVKFVDDLELAYVAQRYREVHDLFHTLLNMPTNMLGEVTVKWVEAIQTRLPMCAAGALFGSIRLAPKSRRYYSTKIVELESSLSEKIRTGALRARKHPGVMSIPCTGIPSEISTGIKCVLEKENLKELATTSEAFRRQLECRLMPLENDEKEFARQRIRENILRKNPTLDTSDERVLGKVQRKVEKRLSSLCNNWKPIDYNRHMGLKYLISRGPAEYAVMKRIFNEIVKRDENFAPKTLFDFGSGIGTVEWAAHDIWGKSIKEYYCVDTSKEMNDLSALILRNNDYDNEPFIQNVFYRQFLPAIPSPYDIVVSAFTFLDLPNYELRIKTLVNLWNKTDNYFVLVENGRNAGFHLILEARDFLLSTSQDHNIDCYVFAPCPHDLECPRLNAEGKRTPCNFLTKYKKFNMPKVKNETGSILFSFLIMKKGKEPPESERKPRIVREVLKRKGHVVCKLCTNEGELTQIFASKKKCGSPAYKCLRVSSWGDLIPGSLVERVKRLENKDLPEDISSESSIMDSEEYISSESSIKDSEEYISDESSGDSDSDDSDSSSSDDSDDETDKPQTPKNKEKSFQDDSSVK